MNTQAIHGRINDVDSHEMIHPSVLGQHFGAVGAQVSGPISARLKQILVGTDLGAKTLDAAIEATPVDAGAVGSVRGFGAPGAVDIDRRLAVLDILGVRRQLVFPGFIGAFAVQFASSTPASIKALNIGVENLDPSMFPIMARKLRDAHNDWAVRIQARDPQRLRPVGVLLNNELDEMLQDAEAAIRNGLGGVMLSSATPPGGLSPADAALDAFWATCAKGNLPLMIHVLGERDFLASSAWGNVPQFKPTPTETAEVPLDPFTLSTIHLSAQNYVTAMVLGGVFERHPGLRLGIIELGAHWIGPLSEALDLWADQFAKRLRSTLSMKPSDYIKRNIRCSSFHFEDVYRQVERYGLDDVYCFATDYPHPEGGKQPLEDHLSRISDASFREKFFVTNANWIMPG